LTLECPENEASVPSPGLKKTCDEVSVGSFIDVVDPNVTSIEHTQQPSKTEKGSNEEGFCCVMNMHDGVVL
jgi:hypothetical protein